MLLFKWLLPLSVIFLLQSCHSSSTSSETQASGKVSAITYARRFSLSAEKGYKVLKLFGDRNSTKETATFILYSRTQSKPDAGSGVYYVPVPVQRVASMSSVYTTMIATLGLSDRIVAIDNADYYTNKHITEQVAAGKIVELSKGPEISVEQTLILKPDLVLTFGMGNPDGDINPKITAAGIPVAASLDHLEDSPLARAEWIKFVAAFFDKDALADSLFAGTEKRYLTLKALADTVKTRPTVLSDMKYGDAWYVPGGNSYIAHLLRDAGADYLWKSNTQAGSVPLTFETVYKEAHLSDFWIHPFMVNSKKELLGYDPRYASFKAFQTGSIYNNNKEQNNKGYSSYWETGITNPDAILEDLVSIFHPALRPGHVLTYYKKIE